MNHTAVAVAIVALSSVAGCSSTPPIEELRTHANEAFAREEYKRAVAFDTEILRLQPDDYSATIQRGVAYDRLGAVSDASADFTRAIEIAPEAGLPRLYRANLALKANQVDMAVADVQAMQDLEMEKHEQVAALVLAGTVHQKKGDAGGALRAYRGAIEVGKNDPDPTVQKHVRDAFYNAAECNYRTGNFDQATSLYGEVVQAKVRSDEPVTEDDHYTMGVLNYLRGDFARSKQHFAHVSPGRKRQAAKLLNDEGFFASAR